jgi:hypothetical protein
MEKSRHPLSGHVLTLSQQGVYATLDETIAIIRSHNIMPKDLRDDFDTKNKIPSWNNTRLKNVTNAQTVLSLLGADSVSVADCSTYENPNYVIDLNETVGKEFHDKFNVILDVGTLEHVFDLPTALINVTRMLKSGGNIILILPAAGLIDHGFYGISPTLLFDFFGNNGFDNISCYLLEASQFNTAKKAKVYKYDHVGDQQVLISKKGVEVAFFATKKSTSTSNDPIIKPMQSLFLNMWQNQSNGNTPAQEVKQSIRKRISSTFHYYVNDKYRPEFIRIYNHNRKRRNLRYIGKI